MLEHSRYLTGKGTRSRDTPKREGIVVPGMMWAQAPLHMHSSLEGPPTHQAIGETLIKVPTYSHCDYMGLCLQGMPGKCVFTVII